MNATKYVVLASLLLAGGNSFGQASKAQPSGGLSIGTLNGPTIPHTWPFKSREAEARAMPPFFAPVTRSEPRFLPPLPEVQPLPQGKIDPGDLYYLLKTKSVETADGIIGLKLGAKLRKQPDGSYLFSGIKVTLADSEVTNDPEVARQAGVSDVVPAAPIPAPIPAPAPAAEPGHARLGETIESFRRTPNLQWLGGSSFQLDTYSIVAVFLEGKCHEITFADLVQETTSNHALRDARRSTGQYDKFFTAVLKANAGNSEWIEESSDPKNRKWRRADGAVKAEATNNETRAGVITLTTMDLVRHRLESAPGYQRVLEGL